MKTISQLVLTSARTVAGDFSDSVKAWNRFIYFVASLPGVTILGTLKHEFEGGGFSGLILLGESHAAIHTWPEHGVAWVELATCGDPSALTKFEHEVSLAFSVAPPGSAQALAAQKEI